MHDLFLCLSLEIANWRRFSWIDHVNGSSHPIAIRSRAVSTERPYTLAVVVIVRLVRRCDGGASLFFQEFECPGARDIRPTHAP